MTIYTSTDLLESLNDEDLMLQVEAAYSNTCCLMQEDLYKYYLGVLSEEETKQHESVLLQAVLCYNQNLTEAEGTELIRSLFVK